MGNQNTKDKKLKLDEPTVCSKYEMPDGKYIEYETKTRALGFVPCMQDEYFLSPTSNSIVDLAVIGTYQPNPNISTFDYNCPSDPCDYLSSIKFPYQCQDPNSEPCTEFTYSACQTIDFDYNNPPCNFTYPKTKTSDNLQCSDAKNQSFSNCFQLQNVCVPKQPPVSADNLYSDPNLIETAAQCCVGDIVQTGAPYTCGIGLCQGGRNCPNVIKTYCSSDPDSILYNSICRKFMNSPGAQGSSDKATKETLLENFLKKNMTDYVNNGNLPENNTFNKAILDFCTSSVITDGNNNICNSYLTGYCSKIQTSYQNLENGLNASPPDELTQLCGCYLNKYPYEGLFPSQCQPICIQSPLQDASCVSTECLLDLNIANIIINDGKLNLNQVCNTNVSVTTSTLTPDAYNKIVNSKTQIDLAKIFSECRIINSDGTTSSPIKCPKAGDPPLKQCSQDKDCGSGFMCDDNVCVPSTSPESSNWWVYLLIGLGVIIFLIGIGIVVYLIMKRKAK
jgi:hypothetical protein